jgi:hypothetical protein
MHTTTRARLRARLFIVLTAAAVALGAVAPAQAEDGRPGTREPAKAAAGWLATQLVDGDHMAVDFGGTLYDDAGLTADSIIAFAAAGVAGDAGDRATAWLAEPANLSNYVGDGSSAVWAGATAKAALVAETQGLNPSAFGGVNLVNRLLSRLQASGRFTDKSDFGDFSNAIGQSLGVIALKRNGNLPGRAVTFLANARCADGSMPLLFGGDCTGHIDATGFAAQAFLAAGWNGAATAALDWLESQQASDGGFGSPKNANSTGLAAQALWVGGRKGAAEKALTFIRHLQVYCGGRSVNRGAIRFQGGDFDASTATRATAQATPALAKVGLLEVSDASSTPESAVWACGTP